MEYNFNVETEPQSEVIKYWCKYCDFKTTIKDQLFKHVETIHIPKKLMSKVEMTMNEINERSLDEPPLNELLKSCQDTFDTCAEILLRKNRDYAGLGNPFKNFDYIEHLGIKSEVGVLVRLNDKMMRISNLLQREAFVVEETIDDTINDAINYLAILKAILQRNKNK